MTRRARHLARMRRRSPKQPRWFRGQIDFIRAALRSPTLKVAYWSRDNGKSSIAKLLWVTP